MATTISFINEKGGVGKSSVCFHLAGSLAASGLHVLVFDFDPQGWQLGAWSGRPCGSKRDMVTSKRRSVGAWLE